MVKLIFYKYSNIRMESDDSDSVACCKSQEYLKSINNMVVRNKLNEHNGTSVTTFQKPSRNSQDPLNHHLQ